MVGRIGKVSGAVLRIARSRARIGAPCDGAYGRRTDPSFGPTADRSLFGLYCVGSPRVAGSVRGVCSVDPLGARHLGNSAALARALVADEYHRALGHPLGDGPADSRALRSVTP